MDAFHETANMLKCCVLFDCSNQQELQMKILCHMWESGVKMGLVLLEVAAGLLLTLSEL